MRSVQDLLLCARDCVPEHGASSSFGTQHGFTRNTAFGNRWFVVGSHYGVRNTGISPGGQYNHSAWIPQHGSGVLADGTDAEDPSHPIGVHQSSRLAICESADSPQNGRSSICGRQWFVHRIHAMKVRPIPEAHRCGRERADDNHHSSSHSSNSLEMPPFAADQLGTPPVSRATLMASRISSFVAP